LLQNPHHHTHLTLTLENLKKSDMDENANKLHLKFTAFNSSMRVTVYAECIYVSTEYLKY